MLPIDTITRSILVEGSGNIIIDNTITVNNPATVLGLSFTQSLTVSNTAVYCGSDLIFINWAKDVPYFELVYICKDTLQITKTGNDDAMVVINYIPRDYSVQVLAPATTTPAIDNSITYGDVLIGFFLFILLVGLTFGFLVKRFIMRE